MKKTSQALFNENVHRCESSITGHVFKSIPLEKEQQMRCMCGHVYNFRRCVRCEFIDPWGDPGVTQAHRQPAHRRYGVSVI